jgi:NitT/TauT family transport system permease protein
MSGGWFTVRGRLSRGQALALGLLSVVLVLLAYAWLSHTQHALNPNDTTIPSFVQLWDGVKMALEPNARSGERWLVEDAIATANRLAWGLGLGTALAVLLGLHMGVFPAVEALFIVPLSLAAKVPPTAAMAVFFALVGLDNEMYISMIVFGVTPTLAQAIFLSVKEVPMERVHKAHMLGASRFEVVWSIVFREILPKVIDAVRLQIGPAMVFLIAAEMVVGDVGFGYRIRLQSRLLHMNVVYPYLLYLAAFGFCMDWLLRKLQSRLCRWYVEGGG